MPRSHTANLDQIKANVQKLAEKSAKKLYTAELEAKAVQDRIAKLKAQEEPLNAAVEAARKTNQENQDALVKLGGKPVTYTPATAPAETTDGESAPAETTDGESATEADGESAPADQLQEAAAENTEPESAQARRAKRGQR